MPNVTINDLFAEIGRLYMEKQALEREMSSLIETLNRNEVEDVSSTIPSAVSGPDDNADKVGDKEPKE